MAEGPYSWACAWRMEEMTVKRTRKGSRGPNTGTAGVTPFRPIRETSPAVSGAR